MRLIRLLRLALGAALVAWAAYHLGVAWVTRPILGVMPWGDPTGLRISPLGPSETAETTALERRLAGRWAEGLDTGS